jgi:hypothetical protein
MRPHQVFAGMSPEQATAMLRALSESAKPIYAQAVAAASVALKMRPTFLQRQPLEKRAAWVRRALSRVRADDLAEELLAVYFLECRKPLLVEWLDALRIGHEDGTLTEDAPKPPPDAELEQAVARFRGGGDDADRELLLRAFAAQRAIDWPGLDALLEGSR